MWANLRTILFDKTAQICIFLFAAVFGAVKSLSNFVYEQNIIAVDARQILIYSGICWLALEIVRILSLWNWNIKTPDIKSPRLLRLIFFTALVLLHTLCWLVYWPAIICHDNMGILMNGLGMSHQHPILYNAFVTLCKDIGMAFGSARCGVVLYIGIQIAVIDAIIACLIVRLLKMRVPMVLKIMSVLYYLLTPMFMIYGVEMIKDPLWSIAMAVLTLELYEIVTRDVPLRKNWIMFGIATFFVMTLRNNGNYIMAGTWVVLLILGRKRLWRGTWVTFLVMILTVIAQAYSMKTVGAKQLFQEKVSVPIQQIAATVKNNGVITPEQAEFIETIVPLENLKQRYYPYNADPIKWGNPDFKRSVLEAHPKEFLEVWRQMMLPNFNIYVLAYLQESYWWWAPRQDGKAPCRQTWHHGSEHLMNFATRNNLLERPMIAGKMYDYLHKYYEYNSVFLREGVLFWLLAAMALLYGLKRKKLMDMMVYLPCFLLWATIMIAAPIAYSMRFVLSFAYLLPFFALLLFTDREDEIERLQHIEAPLFAKRRQKYVCFALAGLLCAGISRVCYVKALNYMPITARVDISSEFAENALFEVYKDDTIAAEAEWMPKNNRRGVVVSQYGNRLELELKALADGEVTIYLRGPDIRDKNGKQAEAWVKYRAFTIDENEIINENTKVWHNKPYKYIKKIEKGKIYRLKFKWRKV